MKYNYTLSCSFFIAAFFLLSCSGIKQVALDTVTVKENTLNSNVFRGSYTKLTDIIHTKLDLSFQWDSAYVIGQATIQAKPYFYSSNQVVLDANGFRVNEVSLFKNAQKQPLRYTYNGKQLIIQLDKTYTKDQIFTLFIDYVAMPNKLQIGRDIGSAADRGIYFINKDGKDKDKPQQIWTQGETECNSNWFPTINGPQEKMKQDLNITVPNEFVTLSNGTLEYSSLNGNGTRTDSWRQELPHSTYLTMLAVGKFTITIDTWNDKEVSYYTEPKYASTAKLIFGKTPEMMDFFSKKLGVDYPWEKYSQIVVRDFVSGAMENTSATVFFDGLNMTAGQYLDENYEDIISHELFHHWFGDLVTAESWANLPLNESFATYGEYLWDEYKYGVDAADLKGLEDLRVYLNGSKRNEANVIRYNYADREHMFDEISYQKGGRIIHMLRKTVGDEAFFKALNLYLTRNAYKTAEIHDLRMAFEEVTGQDLNWFFNQWFLASGHPVITIKTFFDAEKSLINVNIQQKHNQATSLVYRIPLSIDIYSNGKVERQKIILDKQSQTFSFASSTAPNLVNVDAEKFIVGEKIEAKTLNELVFQFQNAPLFMDRYEALLMLKTFKNEKAGREIYFSALKDKNWFIRKMALEFMHEIYDGQMGDVYKQVGELARRDEVSHVRAAAVKVLGSVFSEPNNSEIFNFTIKDKAPSVVKATLEAQK